MLTKLRRCNDVKRIGVDIDNHNGLGFIYYYCRALLFGSVSSYYTKHGFHLDVKLNNPVDLVSALDIRRMLGNDPARIQIDEHRVYESGDVRRFDTLFEVRVKNGKTYRRREINPLSCGPYPVEGCSQVGCPEGYQERGQEVYSG